MSESKTTEPALDARHWAEIIFRHAHKLEPYPDCIPRMVRTIEKIQEEAFNAGMMEAEYGKR
jgi:hypothetical protein